METEFLRKLTPLTLPSFTFLILHSTFTCHVLLPLSLSFCLLFPPFLSSGCLPMSPVPCPHPFAFPHLHLLSPPVFPPFFFPLSSSFTWPCLHPLNLCPPFYFPCLHPFSLCPPFILACLPQFTFCCLHPFTLPCLHPFNLCPPFHFPLSPSFYLALSPHI